jgi:hypothetical protein
LVSHAGKRNKLKVLGNRERRGMFGSKNEKVTGVWRRLLNEEFYNLYSLPNITGLSVQIV